MLSADLADELPPLSAKALCLFWIPRDAGDTSASAPVMVQHEATSSSGSLTFILHSKLIDLCNELKKESRSGDNGKSDRWM
jgi:hypothetical protein